MKKSTSTSVVEKPNAIKWAKGLAIFQLSVGVLVYIFFLWLFITNSTNAVLVGMRQGVATGFGQPVSYLQNAEGIGYLTGIFIWAWAAPILALTAISRRSKNWTIASLVIYTVFSLSSLSPVGIAIIILMLVKPSRAYLGFEK